MKKSVKNILFITWDGPETMYLERLFLPIFASLEKKGYKFHVLQFGWGTSDRFAQRAQACAKLNIPYKSVKVFRLFKAIGSFLTAFLGQYAIQKAVTVWNIDTLMPRSLMPALAVLSMPKAERNKLNIIFDADGLVADERVDFSNISSTNFIYRFLRDIEMQILCYADAVLTRTNEASKILQARAGAAISSNCFFVVSNGENTKPYQKLMGELIEPNTDKFILCYCGSLGEKYCLSEMLLMALKLKSVLPNLEFRIFTSMTSLVELTLKKMELMEEPWISFKRVDPNEIPNELVKCDLGLLFLKKAFSIQAVTAIKLGEYLMAGLPVLGSSNIGNFSELNSLGVLYSAENEDMNSSIDFITKQYVSNKIEWKKRCHEVGLKYFSLESTVSAYEKALKSIRSNC